MSMIHFLLIKLYPPSAMTRIFLRGVNFNLTKKKTDNYTELLFGGSQISHVFSQDIREDSSISGNKCSIRNSNRLLRRVAYMEDLIKRITDICPTNTVLYQINIQSKDKQEII
ncbi:hypothetical protein KUTeg_015779 [Tegillarca granosa]|uniref:Uncharacterized protein n=1 Tax=Tegillarca granosa TaxID=220873 RepID=A0ABQ9ENA3_TEGGR|nr:hypothetical protein KUTeg_015779 [Tegillarca granosa]